jgi:uncharacterized 2Fe-2S/4Fe-4S cluster protein (DUF4445 family)
MPKATVNGIVYNLACGARLSELLLSLPHYEMPCAAKGICGKCKVRVSGSVNEITADELKHLTKSEIASGVRLACRTLAEGDCTVEILNSHTKNVCLSGNICNIELKPSFCKYGIAIDIGTTTLAARLYNTKGELLSEFGEMNPQRNWGDDVISRVEAALGGQCENITSAIRNTTDNLIMMLCRQAKISPLEIDSLVITGNTVMLSFLTDTSVVPFSKAPFKCERLFGEELQAEEIGLQSVCSATKIYIPNCISAFIGADAVNAVLASEMCAKKQTSLVIDIGTNGEMALWHNNRLYFCSTAAGPAFEGVGISMGMSAREGAIDIVKICDGKMVAHTIGEVEPIGICGSGIIDAVSCLLSNNAIDEAGYLENEKVTIGGEVTLNQKDIRAIQLSKSAIYSGVLTLLNEAKIDFTDIEKVFIAGGFGSYIDVVSAGNIRLLPNELIDKVVVMGNAALSGAVITLLNKETRNYIKQIVKVSQLVDLAANKFFIDKYVENIMF